MAEEFLADVTIGKVYKGKEGEGQYGKWVAWNFYVNGDDRKFSYFSGGKKPEPKEGMHLKMMRFEVKQSGQYTNYNVSEIFANGGEKPPQTRSDAPQSTISQNKGNDIGPMTMWGKYIGEIICAFIGQNLEGEELDVRCKEAMDTFVDCCLIFEKTYSNVIELPKSEFKPSSKMKDLTVTDETGYELPPLGAYNDDQIPF